MPWHRIPKTYAIYCCFPANEITVGRMTGGSWIASEWRVVTREIKCWPKNWSFQLPSWLPGREKGLKTDFSHLWPVIQTCLYNQSPYTPLNAGAQGASGLMNSLTWWDGSMPKTTWEALVPPHTSSGASLPEV